MSLPSYTDPPFACPPDEVIGGVIIDLPCPPSVNRIWRANRAGANKVSKSAEYKSWLKRADALAMSTGQFRGLKTIAGPFEATIILKRIPGDLDNRAKGVLDWLQSRAVISDDKYCERLVLEWGDAPTGCRVTVRPRKPTLKGVLHVAAGRAEAIA
jgi:Holliday junction resolvase RusA-like endonuclease